MSSRLDQRIRRGAGSEANLSSLPVDWSQPVVVDRTTGSPRDVVGEARQSGYEAGYQAAMAELQAAEIAGRSAQLRRIADALTSTAQQVSVTRREAITMGASEAVELAYQLTETFLQRELATGQPVTDSVIRAMRLVPEGHDLIVRLHPGDPVDAETLAAMAPDVDVKVVADPAVEAGGCVVSAGSCRVDTQLRPALARAREVLLDLYPDARLGQGHDDADEPGDRGEPGAGDQSGASEPGAGEPGAGDQSGASDPGAPA